MATLDQVTKTTRKLILIVAILVVALVAFQILLGIGTDIKERFYPTPPPKPTVLFGTIPNVAFPKQDEILKGRLTFTLDTLLDKPLAFPAQMKVYKLASKKPSLLAVQQARKAVATLGFTVGEKALSQTLYQWSDPQEKDRIIQFDVMSKNFTMTSDFYHNKAVLIAKNLPQKMDAQRQVLSFLSRLELTPSDLDLDKTNVSFLTIEGTSLVPTTSLSNAQIVRVDLFQKPIEKTPIIYNVPGQSPINFLIGSFNDFDSRIVEGHFTYQAVESDNFATYPLKTANEMIEETKKGNLYIAQMPDKTKAQITLAKISLAYYANPGVAQYLMPIYILEGDGFVGYVSAISESWIHQ